MTSYLIHNGDIAFGLDPDCHYWNDGIYFTVETAIVPKPVSIILFLSGLAGFMGLGLKRKK